MKIQLTFIYLLAVLVGNSQQFNFNQLVEMTNDYKIFEIKMIKALNQPFEKSERILYSHHTIDGGIGCGVSIPTNDSKYEPKYKFDDGKIYLESEIDDNKIDENFDIRNKLRSEGRLINAIEIDGFSYERSKIISLIKGKKIKSGFAQNYNSEEQIATTWYSWESDYYKKILEQSKYFAPNYKKLSVQFVIDSDFSNTLNQIIAVSKYIDTKEEYGSFISNYKYGIYSITSERNENGNGGNITIYLEYK